MAILLLAFILTCTSVDYIQFFGIPAWALLGILSIAVLMRSPRGRNDVFKVHSRLRTSLIIPWLLLCGWMLLLDYMSSSSPASAEDLVPANIGALFIFLVSASVSSSLKDRTIVRLLIFVGLIQALIGILQYSGFEYFWDLPDNFLSAAGVGDYFSAEEARFNTGRVRGLSILVHKFSVMIGMLAAFSSVFFLLGRSALVGKNLRALILASTPAIVIALFLTFSRAPILGMLVGVMIVVPSVILLNRNVRTFRFRYWLLGTVLALALMFALADAIGLTSLLFVEESQSKRLLDFSGESRSDSLRWETFVQALQLFKMSPIAGVGLEKVQEATPIAIHNVPLKIVATYGIVGFFLYGVVWCSILRRLIACMRRATGAVQIFFIAALCALVVGGIDSLFHTSGLLFRDFVQPCLLGCFLGQALAMDYYESSRQY